MGEARNETRKRKALVGSTFVALFAALIAAGTFIAVPLPLSDGARRA